MRTHDFRPLPDLASRTLAGSVVYANDELFAERENLIKPEPAVFSTGSFGHKGKIYDGWETRRRREPGLHYAIVRLGVPGVVHGVVVDTAWFKGNYPPFVSVEATSFEGFPTTEELTSANWVTVVEKSEVKGDSENPFDVSDAHRYTHVRLTIYPDGGVARFRVHSDPMPDPRLLTGTIDLAGLENGGTVIDCSNMFYSSPLNILRPDRAHTMDDGWAPGAGTAATTTSRSGWPPGDPCGGWRSIRPISSATPPAGLPCAGSTPPQPISRTRRPGWSWCRRPGCSPTPGISSARQRQRR
jgi:allantoicase